MYDQYFNVKCRCGKVHSYYGKEAEILWKIVNLYGKRTALRNERFTAGVLSIVQDEAKCCEKPLFRHHQGKL